MGQNLCLDAALKFSHNYQNLTTVNEILHISDGLSVRTPNKNSTEGDVWSITIQVAVSLVA